MTTIGFLHTADVHVATFRELRAELAPELRDVHVVDPALLAGAQAYGMTPALIARIDDRLSELAGRGAQVIVCTCSTLGPAAEDRSATIGRPVLRVDRPMAEAAVAAGRRIAVVAAVESTLGPTLDLLRESAVRAGVPVTLLPAPCLPAWQLFTGGDVAGYARTIAASAREVAPDADVVVLAQASMAPAAALLADLPVPVLTSPRAAVAGAIDAFRGRAPSMTEVLLFHHAQGRTDGVLAFAEELRRAGHVVHTPDLYDGHTFDKLDDGLAYVRKIGFGEVIERGVRAAGDLPAEIVYAGFSLGGLPAQCLAQTRPGARGALLLESCVPVSEFGRSWPAGVPVQVHGMDHDPSFAGEGDLDAARELVASADQAELFLYPGDGHLFADRSLASYDRDAAELLTRRVLDFLAAR